MNLLLYYTQFDQNLNAKTVQNRNVRNIEQSDTLRIETKNVNPQLTVNGKF